MIQAAQSLKCDTGCTELEHMIFGSHSSPRTVYELRELERSEGFADVDVGLLLVLSVSAAGRKRLLQQDRHHLQRRVRACESGMRATQSDLNCSRTVEVRHI